MAHYEIRGQLAEALRGVYYAAFEVSGGEDPARLKKISGILTDCLTPYFINTDENNFSDLVILDIIQRTLRNFCNNEEHGFQKIDTWDIYFSGVGEAIQVLQDRVITTRYERKDVV
jgi:hypothetical protein